MNRKIRHSASKDLKKRAPWLIFEGSWSFIPIKISFLFPHAALCSKVCVWGPTNACVPGPEEQRRIHGDGRQPDHVSDLTGDHSQFLEIDQSVHFGVVTCNMETRAHFLPTATDPEIRLGGTCCENLTLVQEGEVFLYDGEKRNDRRLEIVLVQQVAVFRHVARRVEHLLQFGQQFFILGRQTLPRSTQT